MLSLKKSNFNLTQNLGFPENDSTGQNEEFLGQKMTNDNKPLVLIFGSDRDTRSLFRTALEIWDFEVTEAENIEESFFTAEIRCPDLVLMDTVLKFSDSLTALNEMQKNSVLSNVPFIMLSGHAQETIRQTAFASGVTEYLVKPVDFNILEQSLRTCLNNGRKK